jgi:hypothetical protein
MGRGPPRSQDKARSPSGPRVGIDYAEEFVDEPWRFWVKGNEFVSKSRTGTKRFLTRSSRRTRRKPEIFLSVLGELCVED